MRCCSVKNDVVCWATAARADPDPGCAPDARPVIGMQHCRRRIRSPCSTDDGRNNHLARRADRSVAPDSWDQMTTSTPSTARPSAGAALPALLLSALCAVSIDHRSLWRDEMATRQFALLPVGDLFHALTHVDLAVLVIVAVLIQPFSVLAVPCFIGMLWGPQLRREWWSDGSRSFRCARSSQ